MLSILKSIDKYITLTEEFFVGIGVLITAFLVFTQVVSRFIFSFSFTWIEEMSQYIMLWVVFIAAALCVKKNEHVSVDVIFSVLPKKYRNLWIAFLAIISACFLCWFAYTASTLVASVKNNYQTSVSMTWLPIYIVYLSAPIGTILMSFEFFKLALRIILSKDKSKALAVEEIPKEKI